MPETDFATYTVVLRQALISPDEFSRLLRTSSPPLIVRIKDDMICLDARTINDADVDKAAEAVCAVLKRRTVIGESLKKPCF